MKFQVPIKSGVNQTASAFSPCEALLGHFEAETHHCTVCVLVHVSEVCVSVCVCGFQQHVVAAGQKCEHVSGSEPRLALHFAAMFPAAETLIS